MLAQRVSLQAITELDAESLAVICFSLIGLTVSLGLLSLFGSDLVMPLAFVG